MNKIQLWGLLLLPLFLFSCANNPSPNKKETNEVQLDSSTSDEQVLVDPIKKTDTTTLQLESPMVYSFPYNFTEWVQKMTLDKSLMEISALAFLPNQEQFLAINDELGQLFFLDAKNGQISNTKKFGDKGDYEGIALVDEEVFIIKSNGTFYQYNLNYSTKAKKIKTALTKSNDVEGLCYDAKNQQLLVACKGSPFLKKNSKQKTVKAVYAFDLATKRLNEKPILTIKDKDLKAYVEDRFKSKETSKKRLEKYIQQATKFSPSAIAIHPKEDLYYLLSTVGKTLVVCDREGNIQHIEFLNEQQQTQPEGLCFSTDGTLYISNEGKGISGSIYQFTYQPSSK